MISKIPNPGRSRKGQKVWAHVVWQKKKMLIKWWTSPSHITYKVSKYISYISSTQETMSNSRQSADYQRVTKRANLPPDIEVVFPIVFGKCCVSGKEGFMYFSYALLAQSPCSLINSAGRPHWRAKEAPPLRNECPEYFEASKSNLFKSTSWVSDTRNGL